jgi:hypothetical protein
VPPALGPRPVSGPLEAAPPMPRAPDPWPASRLVKAAPGPWLVEAVPPAPRPRLVAVAPPAPPTPRPRLVARAWPVVGVAAGGGRASRSLPTVGVVAGGGRASHAARVAPPCTGSPSAVVDYAPVRPPSWVESPAAP